MDLNLVSAINFMVRDGMCGELKIQFLLLGLTTPMRTCHIHHHIMCTRPNPYIINIGFLYDIVCISTVLREELL